MGKVDHQLAATLIRSSIFTFSLFSQVWAYLCLIAIRTGRAAEAEQCWKYTRRLQLEDESLLQEIRVCACPASN